jgi:hypothetical protein
MPLEREYLAQVNQCISKHRVRIANQQAVLGALERENSDTALAKIVLSRYEDMMLILERRRAMLLNAVKRSDGPT